MKRFSAKFSTWFDRLAFWRKPVAPIPEQADTPAPKRARDSKLNEPEPSAAPPTKVGWFTRLKQALRRPRKAAPEQALDPDKTVIIARPSREQLEAIDELEAEPAPKLPLMARLRNKLRRKPKLEALEETREQSDPGERKRARATASDDKNAEAQSDVEDAPKIGFFKRLLAKLRNKWIWIPSVSILLISLIGSTLYSVLHTKQEKEKLQAELQETKKQLKKQVAVVKTAPTPAVVNTAPPPKTDRTVATIDQANAASKLSIDSGDCLVTDIESVSKNLRDCIDSFNSARPSNRKQ